MITKREWHLLSAFTFFVILGIGGTLNFLAMQGSEGRMPFLTDNLNDLGYKDKYHLAVFSCENVDFCYLIDRFEVEGFGYLMIYSIGDIIILFGAIMCIGCLVRWRYLVSKDEKQEDYLPKLTGVKHG